MEFNIGVYARMSERSSPAGPIVQASYNFEKLTVFGYIHLSYTLMIK
jgi:hypothetical protein